MSIVKDINHRFTDAVENLIKQKVEKTRTAISKKLGVSNSVLSDVKSKRFNIQIDVVIKFCEIYNIDLMYMLTGKVNEVIKKQTELDKALENASLVFGKLETIRHLLNEYPNVFKMFYTESNGYVFEADLDILLTLNKHK